MEKEKKTSCRAKPSKPWKPQIGSNHTASSRDPKEVVAHSSACYKELWEIKDSSAIKREHHI